MVLQLHESQTKKKINSISLCRKKNEKRAHIKVKQKISSIYLKKKSSVKYKTFTQHLYA